MTASILIKSALLGAFCLYVLLYGSLDLEVKWTWWLSEPFDAITLVVISPILEEWVFRGWLFDVLKRWIKDSSSSFAWSTSPISLQNILSTLCFCTLHALMRDPMTGLLVFGPSLLLGFIRDRGASLWALIGIHGFWNFGWFLLFPPS